MFCVKPGQKIRKMWQNILHEKGERDTIRMSMGQKSLGGNDMKKMKKSLLAMALTLVMVVSTMMTGTVTVRAEETEDMTGKLVVLHTNDIHGYFEADVENGHMGIDAVAAAKKYYKSLGANVLLLDAGDFAQGHTLVSYYKGMSAIEFMNAAGYDAISLGNHELDFGYDNMVALVEAAEFPVLDANILSKETGKPMFGANTIFEFGELKVGVFGLDTPETQTKASPLNVKKITFLDNEELFACAQAQVDELKAAGCNYIICIGHLGVDAESTGRRSTDLIENVTGIDLFVDGHSHTVFENGSQVKDTLVVSTGNYLNNLGVVVYDGTTSTATLISAAEYAGERDAEVAALVKTKVDEVAAAYDALFAKTLYDLVGDKPVVRSQETNLGNFAAGAYLYAANTYAAEYELGITVDGAISNGGGIRASIPAGDISMNTLMTVFPFGNSVTIVGITGAQLLEALEAACFICPEASGAFPQTAGIKFTLDTTVPYENGAQYPDSTYFAPANPGSRVTITSVGGKEFSLTDTYYIATNNFTAAGGDTYYVLGQADYVVQTEIVDADALIAYVNSMDGVIGEDFKEPAGNITIILPEVTEPVEEPEVEPGVEPKTYTVVKGDYLRKIAKELLGAENLWKKIYEANKDIIANPDVIRIGQELVIPAE